MNLLIGQNEQETDAREPYQTLLIPPSPGAYAYAREMEVPIFEVTPAETPEEEPAIRVVGYKTLEEALTEGPEIKPRAGWLAPVGVGAVLFAALATLT